MANQIENSEVEHQIRDFIAKQLLYSETGFTYSDEVSFLEEGIVDSLGVMELVEFIRKTFGVTVPQNEVTRENFDSVTKLAAFVRKQRGSQS